METGLTTIYRMTNQHPITPPPELVQQWLKERTFLESQPLAHTYLATRAAQWGADQELEACIDWVSNARNHGLGWIAATILSGKLRAARRPKRPSLKEQALKTLKCLESESPFEEPRFETIRRALEVLPE